MKLATPLYSFKREAVRTSRETGGPLRATLDNIAKREGLGSWDLLLRRCRSATPARHLWEQLGRRESVLIAARPNQGKTLFALELAAEALDSERQVTVFSQNFDPAGLTEAFTELGIDIERFRDRFNFVNPAVFHASEMLARLATQESGSLVIVDYLQRLSHATGREQVEAINQYVRKRDCIVTYLSQIDHRIDERNLAVPTVTDIGMSHVYSPELFDRVCFLHDGQASIESMPSR